MANQTTPKLDRSGPATLHPRLRGPSLNRRVRPVWHRSSAVEQGNHNPLVGGSNPSGATIHSRPVRARMNDKRPRAPATLGAARQAKTPAPTHRRIAKTGRVPRANEYQGRARDSASRARPRQADPRRKTPASMHTHRHLCQKNSTTARLSKVNHRLKFYFALRAIPATIRACRDSSPKAWRSSPVFL